MAPHSMYAEGTPNPNTMKFVSNRWLITDDNSYEVLADQRTGGPSPLAEKLFSFPFVNGVFIAANFVTVSKSNAVEWNDVVIELRDFITNYLNSDDNVVIREEFLKTDEPNSSEDVKGETSQKELTDIEKKIVDTLNEYIKPVVETDGGAIEFDSFDYGIVKVVLKGACSGCPSSTMTLKGSIESLLKNMIPEVNEVVAING